MADYNVASTPGRVEASWPGATSGGMGGFDPSAFASLLNEKWNMSKRLMEMEMQERQQAMQMRREQQRIREEQMHMQQWQMENENRRKAEQMEMQERMAQQEADAPFDMWSAQQQHQQERGRQYADAMIGRQGFQMGPQAAEQLGQSMGVDNMMGGARSTGDQWGKLGAASMGPSADMALGNLAADENQKDRDFKQANPWLFMEPGKTGGTIPKDGVYELHKGEKVIPTPETFRDVMMNALTSRPIEPYKGDKKPEGSFEYGAPDIRGGSSNPFDPLIQDVSEEIPQWLLDMVYPEDNPEMPRQMHQPSMDTNVPIDFGGGEPPMPDVAGQVGGMPTQARTGQPYEVTEDPISEQKLSDLFGEEVPTRADTDQKTVKKYEMTGEPESADEGFAKEGQKRQSEIDRYNEKANGLLDTASNLEMYAMERPNSPASQNLMAMAKEKKEQAKNMLGVSQMKQQRKDEWEGKAAEEMARLTAAEIEKETANIQARGRVAAEGVKAGGKATSAQQEASIKNLFKAIETLKSLGMEDEAQALLTQLLPALGVGTGGE